ncbi:MFS transporter [Streptomyces incarnatus]
MKKVQIDSKQSSSLRDRLGFPSIVGRRRLVAAVTIDAIGSGMFMPFAVLYFVRHAHLSAATVGACLSIAAVCALGLGMPIGGAIDRFGPRATLVVTNVACAVAFAAFPWAVSSWSVVAVLTVVATADTIYWAAHAAFVSLVAEEAEQARWFALERWLRLIGNVFGVTLGFVLASVFHSGMTVIVLGNAVSYLVAAQMLRSTHTRPSAPTFASSDADVQAESPQGYKRVFSDSTFLLFMLIQFLLIPSVLAMTLLIPLYLATAPGGGAWLAGLALTLNMVLGIVCQPPAARLAERISATRLLQIAAGLWIASFVLFGLLGGSRLALVTVLALASVAYAAAEVCGGVAGGPLLTRLSPEGLRGRYMTVNQVAWNAAKVVSPLLLVGTLSSNRLLPLGSLCVLCGVAVLLLQHLNHRISEPGN